MPKRSSKKKTDETQHPAPEAEQATPSAEPTPGGKNPAAVALGRLGGAKGGKARAEKLTEKRRREIAKKAAEARWRNKKSGSSG